MPNSPRPTTVIEVSDGLPTDQVLKRPAKWTEMSEPDLITHSARCYDSARNRDSESAVSLLNAPRMKPGNFEHALMIDYFAVTAEYSSCWCPNADKIFPPVYPTPSLSFNGQGPRPPVHGVVSSVSYCEGSS